MKIDIIPGRPTPDRKRFIFEASDRTALPLGVCAGCLSAVGRPNVGVRVVRFQPDSPAAEMRGAEVSLPSGTSYTTWAEHLDIVDADAFSDMVHIFPGQIVFAERNHFPLGSGVAVTTVNGTALCARCTAPAYEQIRGKR